MTTAHDNLVSWLLHKNFFITKIQPPSYLFILEYYSQLPSYYWDITPIARYYSTITLLLQKLYCKVLPSHDVSGQ